MKALFGLVTLAIVAAIIAVTAISVTGATSEALVDIDKDLSPKKYICIISSGPGGKPQFSGSLTFSQDAPASPVTLQGRFEGLRAGATHAFHIHQFGDLSNSTNGCLSAGSHFNPKMHTHGAPEDFNRHVGDLGNLKVDSMGVVNIDMQDKVLSLFAGSRNILGRACVVHAGVDDLGRGNNEESKKTGNAGGRIGCGVVAVAKA